MTHPTVPPEPIPIPRPDIGWFGRCLQGFFACSRWLGHQFPRLPLLTHRMIARWQRLSGRASIDNFGQVTPWLFRGGQPAPEGFYTLAQLGIRTVINLTAEAERDLEWADPIGMKVVYIPLAPFGSPTIEQAEQFLETLGRVSDRPFFVHCFHGSDRTGAMIAVYRMSHQGWTAEQAFAEMRLYGFHPRSQDAKRQFLFRFAAHLDQMRRDEAPPASD